MTSLGIPLMRQKWRENCISVVQIYVHKGVFALDKTFFFQIFVNIIFNDEAVKCQQDTTGHAMVL